uniref:SWI5 dependent homologous recombination repair protein 1 n=1 Tax=Myotis myotis TaxID=51298 RepID=A0A7J7TUP6_MYOMY|nr:SWI5 dependent homologous recombination repair protein 1 [Myotis myotis]
MAEGEVNHDNIFKMESPSDSAVILPRTPQGCASLPSPHTSSSRNL